MTSTPSIPILAVAPVTTRLLVRCYSPAVRHVSRLVAWTMAVSLLAITSDAFTPAVALAAEWCSEC